MIISRLLKSCAMLPVSWPSASIFCDCASCSCARSSASCASRRSVMSRVILAIADQATHLVADRLDDEAGPERGLVAPHLPAFGSVLALIGGDMQRARRLAALPLLLGVEAAEMLADDLVRRILVDPLRAGVPVGHAPVGIEHEDRVIGDALNQQPEAPLAVARAPLCAARRWAMSCLSAASTRLLCVDLGIQGLVGLAQLRRALVHHALQVVIGAAQLCSATRRARDVLRDHDEMTHRAAGIEDGRDTVLDPHARVAGQHVADLGDELLAGADRLPKHSSICGRSSGSTMSWMCCRSRSSDERWTISQNRSLTEREPSGRIDPRDADDRLAEHGVQVLRLLAQARLDPLSLGHVRAQDEAWNGAADHERDQQQEGVVERRACEGAAARQRAPHRKARQDQRGGCGVARAAAQRACEQRHDGKDAQRAADDRSARSAD